MTEAGLGLIKSESPGGLKKPHILRGGQAGLRSVKFSPAYCSSQTALEISVSDKDFSGAFGFLISWPALNRAAALVLERRRELDGDRYEILTPASEALAGKHKLAAVLVLRAMIDFALTHNRSSRYKHAARHLLSCASLSAGVEAFGGLEPHDAYVARLRREHGRKSSFWSLLD